MSKRVLSLFLALVMLVLAVPVFALPTLAAEADPIVKFAVGPTGSNGLNTVGTVVKTTTLSEKGFPTPADIEAAGVDLDLDEVIGWYAYDKAADTFRNVKAYYYGYRTLTDGLTFYPVTKTTYMQGFKNGYPLLPGANQPLWTANPAKNPNDSDKIYYYDSEISTYTGGWVLGSYYLGNFKPFNQAQENNYALFTNWTAYQGSGAYYPTSGDVWTTAPTSDYAMTFAFHAVATGTVKITIPGINMAGCTLAIAQNGSYVWPTSIKGQTATAAASDANKASWGALTHTHADPAKTGVASDLYKEEYITDTLTLDVKAGDQIHFMLAKATASSPYFYPTVAYSEITEVPVDQGVSYVFASPVTEGNVTKTISKCYASSPKLPTDAQLSSAGLTMTTEDIMGWYAYDKTNGDFVPLEAYVAGVKTATEDVVFYPITWNSDFSRNSNSMLYTYDSTNATDPYAWEGFRGGWQPVVYTGAGVYDTFHNAHHNTDYKNLFVRASTTIGSQWQTGGIWTGGTIIVPKADQSTVIGIMYSAMASGTVDVTINKSTQGTTKMAVAKNGVYVYPEALAGQTVNPAANHADKSAYVETSDTPIVVEGISVGSGDEIVILYQQGGANQPTPVLNVSYQEENRGDAPVWVTSTAMNRPQVTNGNKAITYIGNWDYTTYASKQTLSAGVDSPFTDFLGDSWFVSKGATEHNTSANACMSWSTTKLPFHTVDWTNCGFSFNSKTAIASTRYTAECDGVVELSFTTLGSYYANDVNTNGYAIYIDGLKVWPENTEDWFTLAYGGTGDNAAEYGVNYANEANKTMPGEISIKAGQTIEFVISSSLEWYGAWCSRGNVAEGCVRYTSISKVPAAHTSFRDNRPAIDHEIYDEEGKVVTGNYEAISPIGGWDYISYVGKTMANPLPLVKRRVAAANDTNTSGEEWLLPENGTNYSNASGSVNADGAASEGIMTAYWPGYGMVVPQNAVIGTRYTAEYNGYVKMSFDRVISTHTTDANTRNILSYAIFVDGVKVWPADAEEWYTMSYYGANIPDSDKTGNIGVVGQNMAASLNSSMPEAMYVQRGQTIEFLVHGTGLDTYTAAAEEGEAGTFAAGYYSKTATRGNYVDGKVAYVTVYDAPKAQAGVSIDGQISLYGEPTDVFPYNEYGVYVDGKKIVMNTANNRFNITVNAKDGDAIHTVQPYHVVGTHVVLGEKYEVTVNGMLNDYAASGDASIAAAAEATLNYTAAADAYFNDEVTEAPEIVAPADKDAYVEKSESIGVSEYVGENKIKFRGISLLLNDLVNIKIVVDGTLPEGATLQISKSESFDELETLISGKATDDGTGTKFVMDGISAQNWNTDYYIRVVDAEKNVISDTLCYSVAAYYGRMIDRAEASDKLKAVISSLMNLYEAVSAN